MEKLWKGRTDGRLDHVADDFNASLRFDSRMWRQDILGSIAHATMLGKTGIISLEASDLIIEGLEAIFADIDSGQIAIDMNAEDIHTFIETLLTSRIGATGKKLHTARSRNDQVALDLRMYLASENAAICQAIENLLHVFLRLADTHAATIMPGYTHMQRAQPVTFGHHLLAYAAMLLRDRERLIDVKKRTLISPLGAGALAGTTHPIDRTLTAQLLGFSGSAFNSLDAVSDRDFVIEMAFALSLVMEHLSRLASEIITWCSHEYRFIRLSDQYATGSSMMPQKKNPDIAELIRGKTGRVYGDLMALLTTMKGLPLAYFKDLQEDKEAVFDALDTTKACLNMMTEMLGSIEVNKAKMYEAAANGFLNATDLADYLTKKGMPFRDAYRLTGEMVAFADQADKSLDALSLVEMKRFSTLIEEDVYAEISLETCVQKRNSLGGTSPASVKQQIALVMETLEDA